MTAQVRSELLKLRTTRTMAVLILAAAALTLFGACVEGLSRSTAALAVDDAQRKMFGAAGSTVVLMATLAGLIGVTSEFRYGTIRPTLLFEPRRRVVLMAKLVSAALAGTLLGAVCLGVSFAAGYTILSVRGVDVTLTNAHVPALTLGALGGAALGGMLGVAVGTLIRNQAGAIVALLAYGFAIDAALFAAVPSLGRFLPGKAGDALTGQPVEHLLAPGWGALVLAAWTAILVAASMVRNDRSDV